MIKYKSNCAVCSTIKNHKRGKRLGERIFGSTYYNPTGTESLSAIHRDHSKDFSYSSLKNHVKKHQFISKRDYDQARMEKMMHKSEQQTVEEVVQHQSVRERIMSIGMEQIESGEAKVTPNNVLTAARDQMNWESKKADQALQLAEMVYLYASEEVINAPGLESYVETEIIEGDTASPSPSDIEGSLQPDSLRHGVAGDGAPPRPTEVRRRDDAPTDQG